MGFMSAGHDRSTIALRGFAALVASTCLLLTLPSCGSGSSGGGSDGAGRISLDNIIFPDPSDQSTGREVQVPDQASIVQRIEFVFSDTVSLDQIDSGSIQIRDAENSVVPGEYVRNGKVVSFYPDLPTTPVRKIGPSQFDNGGAGLIPDSFYDVTIPVGTSESITSLVNVNERLWKRYDFQRVIGAGFVGRKYAAGARTGVFSIRFRTSDLEENFLSGYTPEAPNLVSVSPADGQEDVSPFLFTDPDGVFDAPTGIRIEFDHPLNPNSDNVSDEFFRLVNVEDDTGTALDLDLGVNVELIVNEYNRSIVELTPSGILPFGNRIGVFYPSGVKGISGGSTGVNGDAVASLFTVSDAGSGVLSDVFSESFASNRFEEVAFSEFGSGVIPAEWNPDQSGDLRAAFSFESGGQLGRFVPLPPDSGTKDVILDTNSQTFPLFDGSTPEAIPGTIVTGGIFNFTSITIPDRVILKGQGRNPLVLTATEEVIIEGDIDVSGINGTSDDTYDSAIAPTPGGPGGPAGGDGGVGNPTLFDDGLEFMRIVPPRFGQHGFGSGGVANVGGRGGEGGTTADEPSFCNPSQDGRENNRSRGSGGGGGSFLTLGLPGKDGASPVKADIFVSLEKVNPQNIQQPLFERKVGPAIAGVQGDSVFIDEDPENDFIGPLGEIQKPLGGQGGGGGGNRHDSAFCWAKYPGFPGVVTESKGGGAGGGGGAFVVQALGTVTLRSSGDLEAKGGVGGCGEQVTCSNWGGGGGGGSGGAIILQSASQVIVEAGAGIDVRGSNGCRSVSSLHWVNSCGARSDINPGAGGKGGDGLIQIQVPLGVEPDVSPGAILQPITSLIDSSKTPSELTPISVGQSKWIDVGQVIRRGNSSPTWNFSGTDASSGRVITDVEGNILNPDGLPFKIDLPPVVEPETGRILERGLTDFIPVGAYVQIQFQGANAIAPGSKEVDPSSIVPGVGSWSNDVSIASGRQFMRYRVLFNIADISQGASLTPDTRTSVMRFIRFPFEF